MQLEVLGKKLRACNGSHSKQDSKMSCRYKKRKCHSGMYEQGKSKTSETALLMTLSTEKASCGLASKFGHYASTSGERTEASIKTDRGLEKVTSEESLQLISLKKKELRK